MSDQFITPRNAKLYVEQDLPARCIRVNPYWRETDPDGRTRTVFMVRQPTDLRFVVYEGETYNQEELTPMLSLNDEQAEEMMDRLWEFGFRPKALVPENLPLVSNEAEQLRAKHLDDMRRLVFLLMEERRIAAIERNAAAGKPAPDYRVRGFPPDLGVDESVKPDGVPF